MPQQPNVIDIPGVGVIDFGTLSSEETRKQAKRLYDESQKANVPSQPLTRKKQRLIDLGPNYNDPMGNLPRTADWKAVGRNTRQMAPVLGAMLATAIAPPSAVYTIPAALAGGIGGALIRGDAPMDAVTRGAGEGALEGFGQGVGTALRVGGKALYSGALKASKALRNEFPDLVQQLMDNGRLITRGSAEAAEDAVSVSSQKADALTAAAVPGSTNMSVLEVARPFIKVDDRVTKQVRAGVLPDQEKRKVVARINRMFQEAGNLGYSLSEATELKRVAQDAATGAYNQMRRGNISQLSTEDLLDAATARGFKEAIERRVPGVREANLETQKLIGQSSALNDAVGRTENQIPFGNVSDLVAMRAGSLSDPLLGTAVKAGAFAPTASALAIAANRLGKQNLGSAFRLGQVLLINGEQRVVVKVNDDGSPVTFPVSLRK